MKLLDQLDSSFAGLICLSQSTLKFSDTRVQEINYLSNQLISQGRSFHSRQENRELLCFTKLFGKEFFLVSKQFEGSFKSLHNLATIEQLTQKLTIDDIKIAVIAIDMPQEIVDSTTNYLIKSFPNIQIKLLI